MRFAQMKQGKAISSMQTCMCTNFRTQRLKPRLGLIQSACIQGCPSLVSGRWVGGRQLPCFHCGARFSKKAVMPSRWSCVPNIAWKARRSA